MMTDAQNGRLRVMIVSLPGIMQNVLNETFIGRPGMVVVGTASGCLSAVGIIHRVFPDLVVIDSSVPESESHELIRLLKQENPFIRSLLLVETTQQLTRAMQAGADLALTSYSLPESLDRVLGSSGGLKGSG